MDKPCTIMLVDDDEDDKMIFMSVINEINRQIDCKSFDNPLNGLQSLQTNKNKPDCIFLDLNMPFMHGFEFLKLIKTSKELDNIPVIIYSTSSREADKLKAKELGASNFLCKPTFSTELKDKLTDVLTTACKA